MLKSFKLLLAGSCFFVVSVFASDFTVGVVDTKVIMQKSGRIKAESEKLKQKFSQEGEHLTKMRKDLVQDISKMRKNATVMSKKKKLKIEKSLRNREQELNQKQMSFSKKLMKEQQEIMTSVKSDFDEIAKKVAKSKNFSLVMDQNGQVLYVNPEYNRTNEIKRRFN